MLLGARRPSEWAVTHRARRTGLGGGEQPPCPLLLLCGAGAVPVPPWSTCCRASPKRTSALCPSGSRPARTLGSLYFLPAFLSFLLLLPPKTQAIGVPSSGLGVLSFGRSRLVFMGPWRCRSWGPGLENVQRVEETGLLALQPGSAVTLDAPAGTFRRGGCSRHPPASSGPGAEPWGCHWEPSTASAAELDVTQDQPGAPRSFSIHAWGDEPGARRCSAAHQPGGLGHW